METLPLLINVSLIKFFWFDLNFYFCFFFFLFFSLSLIYVTILPYENSSINNYSYALKSYHLNILQNKVLLKSH